MSQQAVASIKTSDGPGNYCFNILSSLTLSDKEKLSVVIGDSMVTFNKHIVCSLSPWISDILKDECCCLKDHIFISLPEETSLRGFISLKAVVETGATHELAILDKDELCVAIKLLGMDIQLETVVQENIDNGASAERHEELEEYVNVVNLSNIDIEEDFMQTGADNAQQHESTISTEDMFTQNVEMESEQIISVVGMDGDDTNNNKAIEPRMNNGIEEIQDANKGLEGNMENVQRNLNNMKPVLRECEVRINRISRKCFGIMRNCCVKIKRLDPKFDKALKYLKCNDTITQELHRETRRNPKQRLPSSQARSGDVDTCFPEASSSAAPSQRQRDLHKPSHSTVVLYSANCDEFFSSIGHSQDGEDTPSHVHSTDDGKETPSHVHSTDDGKDTPSYAHSAADDKAIPGHAHCTADGKATQSTDFLTPIKVPNRSIPPQFDGHMSEMDDINTEEEGNAFIDETNTNWRALDFLANNAKTVPKISSSERICLLAELANTDDVNTDGTDLDRDNMESDIDVRIERSQEEDRMCPTEFISNISSLNEKHKNKKNLETSSSKRICLPSEWFNSEVVDDNGFDTDRDKMSDIIDVVDEMTPGDVGICPTKYSNNSSSNEYQQSKPIPKESSSDKICFPKEVLKNSKENYGTLDLAFENHERDIFDIIEDRALKGKQNPSSSNVSSNSIPKEYQGPVEEEIFMEVDNGDLENGQTIHDGSLTSMLPSELDAEVASVSTPSLLGCSKSSKNHVEFSNDDEDVEKQIELVPKIKIKRNLIQWAFEFDSDSILTPPRKTSKRLNVSSDNQSIENQVEESPKKTAKQWKPYSKEEDGNIVRYMKENNMTGRQRGRRNWQQMEEENVCPGRTWQSMKERWIKHIERKLINIASENENE